MFSKGPRKMCRYKPETLSLCRMVGSMLNCRKVVLGSWFFVLSLSLGAAVLCAQDEPPPAPEAPPKPAGYSFPGIGTGQQEGELQPDLSPLTGMQNPTLG